MPAWSSFDKTNINNFYQVFQSNLKMDIFDGLRDRYDALVGVFPRETRKRLTDLEAENLKDIEVKLKGMDQSAVDEKLKIIRRDESQKA